MNEVLVSKILYQDTEEFLYFFTMLWGRLRFLEESPGGYCV